MAGSVQAQLQEGESHFVLMPKMVVSLRAHAHDPKPRGRGKDPTVQPFDPVLGIKAEELTSGKAPGSYRQPQLQFWAAESAIPRAAFPTGVWLAASVSRLRSDLVMRRGPIWLFTCRAGLCHASFGVASSPLHLRALPADNLEQFCLNSALVRRAPIATWKGWMLVVACKPAPAHGTIASVIPRSDAHDEYSAVKRHPLALPGGRRDEAVTRQCPS